MSRMQWSSPLKGIGFPRIERRLSSFVHTVEEVIHKDELCSESNNSSYRNEHVQVCVHISKLKVCPGIISPWETCNTYVVHWEEHQIYARKGHPEVDIP